MAEISGTANPTQNEPLPKRFFGVKPTEHSNPFLATYDYTHKYPEDARYHELDDDARVWAVYNDEARIYDTEIVVEAGESLDVILIFAALFASVLATFVAQSSQALAPDPAAISVNILRELADIQRAQSNGTAISSIPRADIETTSSPSDIWVNGLWFTSLVLSLSTALIAVLAKQWLRQYLSVISGSQKNRALIHYFRRTSFDKWKVRGIIGFLPTLLHVALFLFLAGLVVQLYDLNKNITFVVLGFTAALGAAYMFALFAPVFDPTCPYQTTLTDALVYPWTFALSSKMIQRILGWPFPTERYTPPWATDKRPEMFKAAAMQPVRNREHYCSTKDAESQMFSFRPLLWMDRTTSNPSARSIILDAVGAIYEPDTKISVVQEMHVNERIAGSLETTHIHENLEEVFVQKSSIMERLLRAVDPRDGSYGAVLNARPDKPMDIEDKELALTALSTGKYSLLLLDKEGSVQTFHAVFDDFRDFLARLIESFPLDELPSLPAIVWARFPIVIPGPEDDCTPGFLEFVASYMMGDREVRFVDFWRSNELHGGSNMTIWEYLCPLLTVAGWFSEQYRYRITPLPPDTDSSQMRVVVPPYLRPPQMLNFDNHLLRNIPLYANGGCYIRWHPRFPKWCENVHEELYRHMLGDFKYYWGQPASVERSHWISKTKAKMKAWLKGGFWVGNGGEVPWDMTSVDIPSISSMGIPGVGIPSIASASIPKGLARRGMPGFGIRSSGTTRSGSGGVESQEIV